MEREFIYLVVHSAWNEKKMSNKEIAVREARRDRRTERNLLDFQLEFMENSQ